MSSKQVWIYALACPRTGLVRYVGQSADPERRLNSHLSNFAAVRVREWVAALRADGTAPKLMTLHLVLPGENADDCERRYINHFLTEDASILNTQETGRSSGPGPHTRPVSLGVSKLRQAMTDRRWSQLRASRELDCPAGTVSRWLSGERRPSAVWLFKIRDMLGVEPEAWTRFDGAGSRLAS